MLETRFHLDEQLALQSLDRIVGIAANTILPGHGEPWHGAPAEAVRMVRDR